MKRKLGFLLLCPAIGILIFYPQITKQLSKHFSKGATKGFAEDIAEGLEESFPEEVDDVFEEAFTEAFEEVAFEEVAEGYDNKPEEPETKSVRTIEKNGLQITADEQYEDITEDGDFDLQLKDGDRYISVYDFDQSWLKKGQTAKDVFVMQNENLFRGMTDVIALGEESAEETPYAAVTRRLYQGKLMERELVYDCYLFHFYDSHKFAWVLITTNLQDYEQNSEKLRKVVHSLRTIE